MNNNITQPSVILVKPQLGDNIAAVARVMHNFAFSDLRLVSPRKGWDSGNSIAIAVSGAHLFTNAKIFANINDAVADLNFVYATTARIRNANKPSIEATAVNKEISSHVGKKIGIIFGPENSGLSNSDITLANKIIFISANPNFSSLNLAQAAAIVLQQFYYTNLSDESTVKNLSAKLASKQELSYFFAHLETELAKTNFLKLEDKKIIMMQNISNIFSRIENLTSNEVQALRGIISALSSKI